MPRILFPIRYKAINQSASKQFATLKSLTPFLISKKVGTPLYRFVSYRSSMPQAEQAGRTVWLPLTKDTENRWTGQGTEANKGFQGLYLSGEFLDTDTPFPELDHYLDRATDPNALVSYFKYEKGVKPQLVTAKVRELRSMFLFSLEEQMEGIDLSLNSKGEHPLLEEILSDARKAYPDAFSMSDTLSTLYNHGEDASFCRAIGNALFENTGLNFFQATSVRDGKSSNVIMRATTGIPASQLKPQGRTTFFLRDPRPGEGVFTIADLLYNTQFEPPGVEVKGLPSKAELNLKLTEIRTQIMDNLVQTYNESLKLNPATQTMEDVGARIASVQKNFEANQIEDALAKITGIKQQMTQQLTQNKENLQASEVLAFEVVDSVMGALSDITTVIDKTNREIENPDVEAPDEEGKDIEDPSVEDVNPVIENELVGKPPAPVSVYSLPTKRLPIIFFFFLGILGILGILAVFQIGIL